MTQIVKIRSLHGQALQSSFTEYNLKLISALWRPQEVERRLLILDEAGTYLNYLSKYRLLYHAHTRHSAIR